MPRKPTTPKPIKLAGYTVQAFRGPDANGLFYYKLSSWEDGKRSWKALGWLTRESAEAAIIKASQEPGVTQEAAESEEIKTVKDLLECWLGAQQERQDLKASSFEAYSRASKSIVTSLGSLLVTRIGQRDLENFRDSSMKAGVSPRYVKVSLQVLHTAWRWGKGISEAISRDLPRISVRIPEDYKNNHSTPAETDIDTVLILLNGWPKAGLILLQATGARVGEIANLKWSDVKLTEKAALLSLNGKTGPRTTPIPRSTWDQVTDILGYGIHGYVSGRPTMEQGKQALQNAIRRAFTRQGADGERFSPHGLRRAKVDAMARAGVDIGTAARFTGHSPQVMLTAYRKVSEEDLMGAMEKLQSAALLTKKETGTK